MWDRLEFVTIKDMQAAMVKANVPDAGTTAWKIDLINLAIEHGFNYVVPRMRLLKAPKPAAELSSHAVVPYAAIPLQQLPQSRDAPPGPSAVQGGPLQPPPPSRYEPPGPSAAKRVRAEPNDVAPVVQESTVSAYTEMGVAGKIMNLYEGKWTQVFAPTPLSRGFIF